MSNSLWSIILVAALFTGFLMGYSVPPMVEVGLIGGSGDEEVGLKGGIDKEMEEYYRSLQLEAGGEQGQ